MSDAELANRWAEQFGLALAPLFEANEVDVEGDHCMLLDGGFGSFALSSTKENLWKSSAPASWSWSSNVPHHVTVGETDVAVVRWDKPSAEILSRKSVESQLDAFYDYLTADRVRSSQRVVEHMLNSFRRVRSIVADANVDDSRSIDAFLAFLSRALNRTADLPREDLAGEELLASLSASGLQSLSEDWASNPGMSRALALNPMLAIRHAGTEIFQEAHFELIRAPSPDMFGYTGPAETRQITRGGAHFTPPALARSIVERAFGEIPNLATRKSLTILDPACGSGAFLHEALRTLRRIGFKGSLVLVGRDFSPPAISMASFVLSNARDDWSPAGGCKIDVAVDDSLEGHLPRADLVLMNPPFVAWSALSAMQRDQMRSILDEKLQGRGDFSMAFVSRALDSLNDGGVLGTLVPASLLTLQAAENWRNSLLDQAELRFISIVGDYGLFAYAMVQVSAIVLRKNPPKGERSEQALALVTANDPEATGNGFRALRRADRSLHARGEAREWQLYALPTETLRRRATWRLTPPRTETALKRLVDVGGASLIGDLFDVRQGVRTGMNPVFLLTNAEVEGLPKKERVWFRPAVMNDSLSAGRVQPLYRVFYPYNMEGLAITSEDELAKVVPQYFERFLKPEKIRLQARANIVRANRQDWWGLSERRSSWALDPQPRLVSKYFGGAGGFATDLDAEYIVVQGFAWFLKSEPADGALDEDVVEPVRREILSAYSALMNSSQFEKLLEIFSPHVAGGQFDLSPRYVNSIPVPDFRAMSTDERAGQAIARLAELGAAPRMMDADWKAKVNRLTTDLYGGEFFEQL